MSLSGQILVVLFMSLGGFVATVPLIFVQELKTKSILKGFFGSLVLVTTVVYLTHLLLDIPYQNVINLEIDAREVGVRRVLQMIYIFVVVTAMLSIVSLIKEVVFKASK